MSADDTDRVHGQQTIGIFVMMKVLLGVFGNKIEAKTAGQIHGEFSKLYYE